MAEAEGPWGASWGADDTILFGWGPEGIWQVPGTGGIPEQIITVEDGWRVHGPQMLPGNEWVLFTLGRDYSSWSAAQIVVQSVATGERQVLIEAGRDARYVPTGHLVYALRGAIVAVPFDVGARRVLGGPVPLVEGIKFDEGAGTGVAHFSLADTGSLVYIPAGAEADADVEEVELVWVDREGQVQPIGAEPQPYDWARISPDGTRVAVETRGDNRDVWVYDLARGTLTRLTFDEAPDARPLWTPEGSRVVFGSGRDRGGLFSKAADGTGEVELLLASEGDPWAYGWSADGRLLFDQNPEGIGVLSVDGERATEYLFDTEFLVYGPALSPDGRWMAYGSDESGRQQIYVRPFPNVDDGRWLVSADRGYYPVWAPDGRELYFLTRTRGGDLMVARVETEPTFAAEAPERLFASPDLRGGEGRKYDVAPDGDRFIFMKRDAEPVIEEDDSLVYVQHWLEELKARVPVN